MIFWKGTTPENATYRYNYYTDNCSTRVRDVIDLAVDGNLKTQLSDKPPALRSAGTRAGSRRTPLLVHPLNTVLAQYRPTDLEWEEGFLPLKCAITCER